MSSGRTFRPPSLDYKKTSSSTHGHAFYKAMLEDQEQRNAKERQFEEVMQDRSRRELSLLEMRAEKQLNAVKRFEEEAMVDKAWDKLVGSLQHMAKATDSAGLRQWLTSHFPVGMHVSDLKGRKKLCERLAEGVSSGGIQVEMKDITSIAEVLEQSSVVAANSAVVLRQLAVSVSSLHSQLQSVLASCDRGRSRDEHLSSQRSLETILQHPHAHLLSNDKQGKLSLQSVRAKQAWLIDRLAEIQKESDALEAKARDAAHKAQDVTPPSTHTHQPVKESASPTAVGSAAKDSIISAKFAYIRSGTQSELWLDELRASSMSVPLPSEFEYQLQRVTHSLRYASLSSGGTGAADADSMMDNTQSGASNSTGSTGVPLKRVEVLLVDLEDLLHGVVKGGPQAFLRIFITLSDVVLSEVQGVSSEEDILMYAVVVCGMFRALSANMHKQSARIFHGILVSSSALCVPDVLTSANHTTAATRIALLYAALVGQSVEADTPSSHNTSAGTAAADAKKVSSPLTAAQGWTWLYRAITQLQVMLTLKCTPAKAGSVLESTTAFTLQIADSGVAAACRVLRSFLRLAGNSLYCKYQDKFTGLLQILKAILQPKDAAVAKHALFGSVDLTNLLSFLNTAVHAKYIAPAFYRSQAPFMLDAASLTRYVERERQIVALAEQDKKSAFMTRIKELQIDRMRAIFNRLGVTAESQATAVKSLLEKIIISNTESPDCLKYTLFKIASNIASDCQEDHFNEMDEGHPLKLARVVCGLCGSITELGDLIRAQFYLLCPMTIPKAAEVGLSGEDFLRDMGFKSKCVTNGEAKWEDKSQWLARMSKMLCTYCVVMLQPEQHPLGLSDAWAWLAHIVNINTPRPSDSGASTGPKPPFFTATALEVMLRVTAQELHRAYGEAFMRLLVLVQDVIMPLLSADMPRREELKKFLTLFISTKGREFMCLFSKLVSAT